MAKVIVIGGGLAGISSAVHSQKLGHSVRLIEASPKLGGRTYSFIDEKTKTEIDNGQHLLMGMYSNTFELLKMFGSYSKLKFQSKLEIEILKKNNTAIVLKAVSIFYPINLIIALFRYNAFSVKEKLSVISFLLKVFFKSEKKTNRIDALTWLKVNGQSDNTIKSLWELLSVSALNTSLREASAGLFHKILKEIFFGGKNAARMVLTNLPLNKIFIEPAENYFRINNIEHIVSERILELKVDNNKVMSVITDRREITDFDFIILAIPPFAIAKLKHSNEILKSELQEMETSPIITIHIWEKDKTINKSFVGFHNSPIHWVFSNKNHISVVISGADNLIKLNSNEIMNFVSDELTNFIPEFKMQNVTDYKVLKEKRATLKCTTKNEELRKSLKPQLENLIFAGDWTNTGLPGTIEGAIMSGKTASKQLFDKKI